MENKEISAALHVSPKTVKNYITRIFDKIRVPTRAKAIVKAREAGMGSTFNSYSGRPP